MLLIWWGFVPTIDAASSPGFCHQTKWYLDTISAYPCLFKIAFQKLLRNGIILCSTWLWGIKVVVLTFLDTMCSSSCRIFLSLLVIFLDRFMKSMIYLCRCSPPHPTPIKAMEILPSRIINRFAIPQKCAMFVRGKGTAHIMLPVGPAYKIWGYSLSFSSTHCGQLGFANVCEDKGQVIYDGWHYGQRHSNGLEVWTEYADGSSDTDGFTHGAIWSSFGVIRFA